LGAFGEGGEVGVPVPGFDRCDFEFNLVGKSVVAGFGKRITGTLISRRYWGSFWKGCGEDGGFVAVLRAVFMEVVSVLMDLEMSEGVEIGARVGIRSWIVDL
jgi:hypothetical protein